MTPGIQQQRLSRVVITMDPHPLSSTAKGGNIMASNTLNMLMVNAFTTIME